MTPKGKRLNPLTIVAFIIIGIVLLITNSFKGNPVSAAIATSNIRTYVEETYPDLDLNVPKATYNFKFSEYTSIVESKTSEDTRFAVRYRKGRIIDSFRYEVGNSFTTYRRLQKEFDGIIEDIIAKDFPTPTSLVIADFIGDTSDLSLDMALDIHNPPTKTSLTIWVESDEVSLDILVDRLKDLHELMINHRIPINIYSIRLQKQLKEGEVTYPDREELFLYEFPAERLFEEDLFQVIKEHQREWEEKVSKERYFNIVIN